MTLQLELGGIQDNNVRRALELLAQRFPLHAQDLAAEVLLLSSTGTARRVAFSTNTVTFTAATASANKTITHGLGATPVVVFAIDQTAGSGIFYRTNTYTATTFDVLGFSPFGVLTATTPFAWAAIG